ncbi:MAG: hypothetical protein MI741_11530 [Rhodospirillales bacterium]|nr:hypothetical protein [Rhodospirillales bacterium]
MTYPVLTPRPAMTSRELDKCMAAAKDSRSEALRQIGKRLRSWASKHLIHPVPHPGTPFAT